jgi:hypothetical protein
MMNLLLTLSAMALAQTPTAPETQSHPVAQTFIGLGASAVWVIGFIAACVIVMVLPRLFKREPH